MISLIWYDKNIKISFFNIIFLGVDKMFENLENRLYELTPSEQRYLNNESVYYNQINTTTLDNKKVFQFHLKNMLEFGMNHSHYFIRKQSRFTPVPTHITDVIELNYVYSGQSIQYVNDQEITLNSGDLIIIDTQVSHGVSKGDYHDIILSVNIDQQFFVDHFYKHLNKNTALTRFIYQAISDSQNHNQFLLFRSNNAQKLKLLFQQLMHEVYFPQLLDLDYKNHLLQLIFLELIRSYSVYINGTNEDSEKQQLTLNILSFIDTHYASTSLAECAEYFGYNSSYFSTLIKRYTGQTFKDILQEKRIDACIPLLLYSNESIKDIALEVGFSNTNQFYRLFNQKFNMTPAEYRTVNRKD